MNIRISCRLDGAIQKYKSRVVAQGLTQVEGIDHDVCACRQVRAAPHDSCPCY